MAAATASPDDLQSLREDAEKIVEQFFFGIPHALKKHREFSSPAPKKYLSDVIGYDEESLACIARIRSSIEKYRDELICQASVDILSYLTRLKVRSKSCDPLKLSYWFGQALASKVGEQNELDRKVVLTLTVIFLDMMCEWHCGKKLPDEMQSKLIMSISQGKHQEDFGQFGIYFSIKAISKLGVA
ncbi:MAG: hypothetical protein PHQ60_10135 [Sideroxydans sp.]|nr:hypothetical protein [Sideroxydans sp.]